MDPERSSELIVRLLASGGGAGLAEAATLPLDMAKVRLQVQVGAAWSAPLAGTSAAAVATAAPPGYRGALDCLRQVAATEGTRGLWSGLAPAVLRQVTYSSLSFLLFEPFLARFAGAKEPREAGFGARFLAAGSAGALAVAMVNPVEVVKTQLQLPLRGGRPDLEETLRQIHTNGGFRGFWAGVVPNVARAFLVTAAELGTYAEIQALLRRRGVDEGAPMVVASSFLAGLASASVSTPMDVVKTRLMQQAGQPPAGAGGPVVRYADFRHALFHPTESIVAREGPAALYKGFGVIVMRKVAWCTVFFLAYEDLRARLFALK